MPIDEELRRSDFPTLQNYLKVTLCNIHGELVRRMELQAVAAALYSDGQPPAS